MACCVAVRNNRMWCWESGLKSISDTVISSLPHSLPVALHPQPCPLFRVLCSVPAKIPSLFFTWIGCSKQLNILAWRHVTISCLPGVLPSTLPSHQPCLLLGARTHLGFGYSHGIWHRSPYAALSHSLLGQVSRCRRLEGLHSPSHAMIDLVTCHFPPPSPFFFYPPFFFPLWLILF